MRLLFTAMILCASLSLAAQQMTVPLSKDAKPEAHKLAPGAPWSSSVIEPACPVSWFPGILPATDALHVYYFPMARQATLPDPKSLLLHIALVQLGGEPISQDVPFSRRSDGAWLATLPLPKQPLAYAAYWVEDPGTRQVDNAHGDFFDILFCSHDGIRTPNSLVAQAQTYTGSLAPQGITRPQDPNKAADVLRRAFKPDPNLYNDLSQLWSLELQAYGDTPEGRARVGAEVEAFINQHIDDEFALSGANNFVNNEQGMFSDAFKEKLWTAIEKLDPKQQPRLWALLRRAEAEKDPVKRKAALNEIAAKYPDSEAAGMLYLRLFLESHDLSEQEELYPKAVRARPNEPSLRLTMARSYLRAGKNFDEVRRLLDEEDKLVELGHSSTGIRQSSGSTNFFSDEAYHRFKNELAVLNSELLLKAGHAKDALALLAPLRPEMQQAHSFYLLGEELEATGDYPGAADAYLDAVLRPSEDDRTHNDALDRVWEAHHLGTRADLENRISAKEAERFKNENYVPKIIARTTPAFDVVSLAGQHLTNDSLRGKKAILNFWAPWCRPCVLELNALQAYQRQHPELVVAAIVLPDNDDAQVLTALRTQNADSLNVLKADARVIDAFGIRGVPRLFIVDDKGLIRIDHRASMYDLGKHLDEDVKAIDRENKP